MAKKERGKKERKKQRQKDRKKERKKKRKKVDILNCNRNIIICYFICFKFFKFVTF